MGLSTLVLMFLIAVFVATFVYAVHLLVTKSRDNERPSTPTVTPKLNESKQTVTTTRTTTRPSVASSSNTPTASTLSSRRVESRSSDNGTPYNYGLYSGSSSTNTSSRSCGYDSSSSSSSDSGSSSCSSD